MAITPDALSVLLREDLKFYLVDGFSKTCPWYSPTTVAANLLYGEIFKKYVTRRSSGTKRKALDTFVDVNDKCSRYSFTSSSWLEDLLVGNFREILYRFFYRDGEETILDCPIGDLPVSAGPGESFGSEGTSFFEKYLNGPVACTDANLIPVFDKLVAGNPAWLDAEIRRTFHHGNPSVVLGSKLAFVPKNDETDRTINIEPPINMLFQLGFGILIEERLKEYFGISLATQQAKNRRLALAGSSSWRSVTEDLKSASDSLALKMCENNLPARVFQTLCAVRSPYIRHLGRWTKLNMIGTMGNGFTFPLQTAMFAAVVKSAFAVSQYPCYDPQPGIEGRTGNWGVFGDDIICPVEISGLVTKLLGLLGFTVNMEKSFFEGPFRESCGADCYKGVDVRAVHIERLQSVQDRFVAINLLARWAARQGIPLTRTLQALHWSVPKNYVPVWESDDSGIHVPIDCVENPRLLVSSETDNRLYSYTAWRIPQKRLRFDSVETEQLQAPLYVSFLYGEASLAVRTRRSDWKDALFGRSDVLFPIDEEACVVDNELVTIPIRREKDKPVKAARLPKVAVSWDHFPTLKISSSVQVRSRTLDPLDHRARKRWNAFAPSYLQ